MIYIFDYLDKYNCINLEEILTKVKAIEYSIGNCFI